MSFYDAIRVGASGAADFEVERSLRFNDDDSAYLNRTPSSVSNRTTFTLSVWVKRASNLDEFQRIFEAGVDVSNRTYFTFDGDDKLEINHRDSGSEAVNLTTTAQFRDVSAWYHIVLAIDTTQGTSSNRIKIYVNGTQQTAFDTSTYPSSSKELDINSTAVHYFGRSVNDTSKLDGYLAEINFIDGTALTPSSFAETDALTGQWNPKKYTGSYGTNGFYLNFSDNSGTTATTLGKDSSGNGNNFTPNNFVTGDAVKDSPTNNFCTFNPLNQNKNRGQASFAEGNLRMTSTSGNRGFTAGTMKAQGKIYFEVLNKSNSGFVGISEIDRGTHQSLDFYQGTPRIDGSAGSNTGQFSSGDIMGVKVDIDAKSIEFFRNNSSVYSATYTTDVEYFPFIEDASGGRSTDAIANFGQDSSFAGEKTAQGNTDANGKGDFYYAPPSGFLALCSANLPDPTIKLPNKHFNTLLYSGNGSSQTITGLNFAPDWVWLKCRNSSSQRSHILTDRIRGATKSLLLPETDAEGTFAQDLTAFTSDGFSVGSNGRVNENSTNLVAWNWNAGDTDGKTYTVTVVDDSGNKYRFDGFGTSAVTLDLAEGGTYIFNYPSAHPFRFSTTADGTHGGGSEYTTGVTHNSSTQVTIVVAASAPTLYYYCSSHSGMGGQVNTNSTLGSSNFDGSIQTTVKVNATAGFSIVTYTGDGNTSATIGHGLGVAPDAIILKNRSSSADWVVMHSSTEFYDGGNYKHKPLKLNTTDALVSILGLWATPNSSTQSISDGQLSSGNRPMTNTSGDNYVAYFFSSVAGYSKFGSYTGNGNADGTFVFTGFRPAWIMTKRSDGGSQNWVIHDIKRDPHNVANKKLAANSNFQENNSSYIGSSSQDTIDILSNGFKMRSNNNHTNISGGTFIYLCFAESPFKNARAR